jgi:transketolase
MAINPSTDLPSWFYSHLDKIDVLIVMSVNPGFSGQQFLPEVLQKMTQIDRKLTENRFKGYIEADGGIDSRTLQQVYDAGAKIVVAGNAVYGSSDIHGAIIQLKLKANIALEKRLLNRSTSLDIRQDWIKARRHVLIPLASELGIEEELNATR